MYAPERLKTIKQILVDQKHADVAALSKKLRVSEVTVRRDLEKLERENFLTRTHGGAILREDTGSTGFSHAFPADPCLEEMEEISHIAAQMVRENDIILLSSGPVNLLLAEKLLSRRHLTVLTNDLNIASLLSENIGIKVVMPCGELDSPTRSLLGKMAEETLRNFYVNKAFLEIEGLSIKRGYSVQSIAKASMLKEMLDIASCRVFICTSKCFDKNNFSEISPLTEANKVISSPAIPEHYKNFFSKNAIELYTDTDSYSRRICI